MTKAEEVVLSLVTPHTDGCYTVNATGEKSFGTPCHSYLVCSIGGYSVLVHRLIALTYLPNPNGYPNVLHKDDIGTHNYADNLMWGTQQENVAMAYTIGSHKTKGVAKRSLEGRLLKRYGSIREASITTGTCESNIVSCCKGRVRTAGGFKWEYINNNK